MLLAILFLFSLSTHAGEDDPVSQLSFGPMVIGEERIPINLEEFPLRANVKGADIKAEWIKGSIQWIRLKNNLLLPRARVNFSANISPVRIYFHYLDKKIFLQEHNGNAESEVWISIFHPGVIDVFIDGKKSGQVSVKANPSSVNLEVKKDIFQNIFEITEFNKSRHLIDYSCMPWSLETKGLDGEFVSVSCNMQRVGPMLHLAPLLEVVWTAVNCTAEDGSTPPFTLIFRDNNPVKLTIIDSQGKKRQVEFSVKIPPRMHRLKTAFGFGPYQYISSASVGEKVTEYAPSVMLYVNYWIDSELSIRAFEAAVGRNPAAATFFNNFGIYFAYELFKALDNRMQTVALLGFQGVTFAHRGLRGEIFSQAILPQGFELTYSHAFGIKKSIFGVGIFLYPSKENPYINSWVRFGKGLFGEVNYIDWKLGQKRATMWGVSVGVPLGGLL